MVPLIIKIRHYRETKKELHAPAALILLLTLDDRQRQSERDVTKNIHYCQESNPGLRIHIHKRLFNFGVFQQNIEKIMTFLLTTQPTPLPLSQQPVTCTYLEPDQSIPRPHSIF